MTIVKQIHKKSSLDGQLTLFLPKREILGTINKVEPIEGVVVYGHNVEKRKIIGQIVVTFRYGREEDEVMGLHFSKDLFLVSEEIYPLGKTNRSVSKIQQKIMDKYGPNAVPFRFSIGANTPKTVTIQPGITEKGQPCGVYYSLRVFPSNSDENKLKANKQEMIEMGIRKTEIGPQGKGRQPSCIIRKDFLLSPGELELEATLDKPLYIFGEQMKVNLSIRNYSNKSVKRIVILVLQNIDVSMFTSGNYSVSVLNLDSQEGCPVNPGSCLNKTFTVCPSGGEGRGVALESPLPGEEKKLASSSLLCPELGKEEIFGIQISYCVRIKLQMGAIAGELVGELPFLLMSRPNKLKD